MIFTGYNTRNIYPQDDIFNYLVQVSCSNTTGVTSFGFSGNSGSFGYLFSGSKVFLDKKNIANNLFINSYLSNEELFFSGNVGKNTHDLFINNNPIFLGEQKSGGYYNYFYINSQNTEIDLSLQINGDSPQYFYSPFESFYSGQNIPITISNSGSYPFKIFSGSVNNSYFSINGVSNVDVTGSYTFNLTSNNFSPLSQGVPINLYTNFGNVVLDFTASGIPNITGDFYLLFGPNKNIAVNAQQNSYTISLKSYTGMELYVSLSYQSGITGDFYKLFEIDNNYTGSASGWITGSGNISSFVTGQSYQYNELLGQNEYGTGSGNVSSFIYSSGNVTGDFSTTLTGLGSGLISYLTGVTGYGVFTFNGVITPAGGTLTRYDLTGMGSGLSEYGIYFGNTTSGVGSIFAPFTGSLSELTGIFSSDKYETVNFETPLFYGTGVYEKFYTLSGLAYATGRTLSGIYLGDLGFSYEPGIYTFYKSYIFLGTGVSSILTGFDPVLVQQKLIETTGYVQMYGLTGVNSTSCDFTLPFFRSTGFPFLVANKSGDRIYPIDISYIYPKNTGEFLYENSNYSITGNTGNFRTNISRLGNTISGSGWFNNVFQKPFYTGEFGSEYGWSEFLTGFYSTGITNGKSPIIKQLKANSYFKDNLLESGRMDFYVTGRFTGLKEYIFKSSVSSTSQYTSISLYNDTGMLLTSSTGLDQMSRVCSGTLSNPYNEYLFLSPGDSYILTGLKTGKYYLVSQLYDSPNQDLGYIGFTNPIFSGCESWGNVYFTISRSGNNIYPFWGKILVTNSSNQMPHATGIDYYSNSGNIVYYNFYVPPCVDIVPFSLPVVNDGNMEVGEYLNATLYIQGVNIYGRSYRSSAQIIILDDDNCCNGLEYCGNNPIPILPTGGIPFPPSPIPDPSPNPDPDPSPNPAPPGIGISPSPTPPVVEPDPIVIPPRPPTPPLPTKKCVNMVISPRDTTLNRQDERPTTRECECVYNNCDCIKPDQVDTETLQIRRAWSLYITGTGDELMKQALVFLGFKGWAILYKDGSPVSRQFITNDGNDEGIVTFSFEENSPDSVYDIKFDVSYPRVCKNFDRVTGLPVSENETSWFNFTSAVSNATNISECISNTPPLPNGCCEFENVSVAYCDCESLLLGLSDEPECPVGYRAIKTSYTVSDDTCECSNAGETIDCYECQLEEVGCSCADYGLEEAGFCDGEEIGIEHISITDESCLNWGTTITCSRCGSGSPGEGAGDGPPW